MSFENRSFPRQASRWQRFFGSLALVQLLLVVTWLARGVPVAPDSAFLIGFGAVSGAVLLVSWGCPPVGPRALGFVVLPAMLLGAVSLLGADGLVAVLVVNAALLLAATLIGGVVGNAIEHPGQLVFVAIVGSAMDVLSVLHPAGPSAALARSEAALSLVALAWPMLGSNSVAPLLGAGDIVFSSLYFAASRRHGLAPSRTLWALGAGYALTLFAVATLERSLPALPFLSATFIIAHSAARRPNQADKRRGALISLAVVVAVALLLLQAH